MPGAVIVTVAKLPLLPVVPLGVPVVPFPLMLIFFPDIPLLTAESVRVIVVKLNVLPHFTAVWLKVGAESVVMCFCTFTVTPELVANNVPVELNNFAFMV
jgi:hypothetical protein